MWYVYEWFIVETNEVIYVGKGCRRRFKVRKHNRFFNDMIKRFNCESRIIKSFCDESEAFKYENERISELKKIGQCVCNIIGGGTGGTCSWWTDERRNEYSKKNVMKSEAQRKRMSENNPMKNEEVKRKVRNSIVRPVIIDGQEFPSVIDAAKHFGVNELTVSEWCKKGVNIYMQKCRYKDSEQVEFNHLNYFYKQSKEIIYDGIKYASNAELAKHLNLNPSTTSDWAKKGFSPKGIECRYVGDTRELVFEKKPLGFYNRKPIIVNGIRYNSKADAEKALGFKPGGLCPYIRGERKNSKYICEYDNQQPSRENSETSIAEGSTTNE